MAFEIDIGSAIALGAVIFGAGGAYALIHNIREKLKESDRSRISTGNRLGAVEEDVRLVIGVLIGQGKISPSAVLRKRAKTMNLGVPLVPADNGESGDSETDK